MSRPTLPRTLTPRDRQAVAAFEKECARTGETSTDQGRAGWIQEWRELDDDDRLEAMEAGWRDRLTLAGFEP